MAGIDMWIFSKSGFLSIVEHREDPDTLIVRARSARPLEENWPECEIITLEEADYRFRIITERDSVLTTVARLVDSVDYDNFKNACHERGEYQRALGSVWRVMFEFQSRVGDGSEG